MMRRRGRNVKMWFKCGTNGELLKGAPGNFKCGQIVSQPYHLSKFPFWELVEEESTLKLHMPPTPEKTNIPRDTTSTEVHILQMEEASNVDLSIKSILYVIEWSVLGGAGVVLKRILENIDRSIYKTDVCVMGEIGGLHEAFSSKGNVFSLKDSKDKYLDLKKIIVEGKYSIVQLYTMTDYLGLVKEIKNTRFIFQLNFPLWEVRQELPYKNWFEAINQTKPYFHSLVSDSSPQLAIDGMQLIENGVDISKFKPRTKDPYLVVWIGRFAREKGLPVMLDIAKTMPNYKFTLIVGFKNEYLPGWKPYQTWLDDAVKNKSSNIEIEIGLSEDEVASRLSKASFFILPSISESSPIVITEAMASGCAVLSTKVGNVPNMINHGVDGFIIPHKELTQLLKEKDWGTIQYHLSPKSKQLDEEILQYVVDTIPKINVAEVGKRARERVKHLTIENQVKRYEFLYGKIGKHSNQTRIAFVWAYPDLAPRFWDHKIDSMQYTIKKLSDENCVILYVPRPKEEHREWAIINGCNIIFYPYNEADKLIPLLKQFNPYVICLNSLHYEVNERIVKEFPDTYKTIYEYGGDLKYPLLNKIDTLFVQQEFRVKEAKEKNGMPTNKIVINPHGVNTDRFKPTETEKNYNAVMVADFRKDIKRQHILIEAWKDVPGKLLLIARLNQPPPYGDYEQQCRQLIKRLGLENRVIIQDFVPNEQLPAIINQCRIGVMTSKREGGSRAMLEVMSCGLPMIVLDDSIGCIEMIRPEVDGLVSSPQKLGSTINSLLNNPDKIKQMGESASIRINKEYPYDRQLSVFKKIISKTRSEISILTTSYNKGSYIEDCLRSIEKQRLSGLKINHVVVDAGSLDNTLEILTKYEDKIDYYEKKGMPQIDSLNFMMEVVNTKFPDTDYIGWINADDWYEDDWLTESLKHMKRFDVTTSQYFGRPDDKTKIKASDPGSSRLDEASIADFLTGNYVAQNTILIRKSSFDALKQKTGFYFNPDFKYTMDYELWVRFLKNGFRITRIRKPLSNLRIYDLQMSKVENLKVVEDALKVKNLLIEWETKK